LDIKSSRARPKEEEVEETTPVDLSSIEVEKKGKKEEEGVPEAPEKAEKEKDSENKAK